MAVEKIIRIQSGTINFEPLVDGVYGTPLVLGHQQKVNLKRTIEKKNLSSNDETIGATVAELVTKTEYEFSTEIGDLSSANMAIAFRGSVVTGTYTVGGKFVGRTIIDDTVLGTVGDPVIHDSKLYIVKTAYTAGSFDVSACTEGRALTYVRVIPERTTGSAGRIVVNGTNVANGKKTTLVIPKVNLIFEGDFGVSGTDVLKLALAGKCIKVDGEDIFTIDDEV